MENVKPRYYGLDMARCFVMFLMPFVHVFEEAELWEFASPALVQSVSWIVDNCVFGAGIFMIIMGMNIGFIRRPKPRHFFERGVYLLVVAYLLNLARYVTPAFITSFFSGSDRDAIYYSIQYTLSPDIMNFASLAFFTFGLFFLFKLSRTKILVATVLLMILNDLLGFIQWNCSELLQTFIGNIFWTCDWSFFPLFSWFSFPVYGYLISKYMLKVSNGEDRQFWRKTAFISVPVVLVMWGIVSFFGMDFRLVANPPINNYVTSTMTVIIDIAVGNIVICCCYELYNLLHLQCFNKYVRTFSENINSFYIMQWIFVGWWEFIRFGMGYRYSADIGVVYYWVLSTSILILSVVIAPYLRMHVLYSLEKWVVNLPIFNKRRIREG